MEHKRGFQVDVRSFLCEHCRTLKVPDVCPSSLLEKAGDSLDLSMMAGEWLSCYEDKVRGIFQD